MSVYTEFEKGVSDLVTRSATTNRLDVEIKVYDRSLLQFANQICNACQLKKICVQIGTEGTRELIRSSSSTDPFADPEWQIVYDSKTGRLVKIVAIGTNIPESGRKLGESLCTPLVK